MKRSIVCALALLALSILVAGCLEYKSTSVPEGDANQGLIDEIAAIEEELGLDNNAAGEERVEEEVILPEFDEELEEVVEEENLPIIGVKENELVELNVRVRDPDQDTVTYSFSKPLDSKGTWQTEYGDAGEYIITITATDNVHSTEKRVKLVVERQNVPPVITPLSNLFVQEGDRVEIDPQVTDPNGDEVTVTISEPLRSGIFETDHTSAGEYQVRIVASDGELDAEETFTLTVADVNVLPEIEGLEDIVVNEGEIVRVKPSVTDVDGDDLSITISEPLGNDGVWETGFTDHGEYTVTVTVSDGKDTVVERIIVTVVDVNMPPEIVDIYVGTN